MNATAPVGLDWDAIFTDYHYRIRGFIRLRVRDRIDADDLAQETFVRAYAATTRGKGPRADRAMAWLFQIARNLCVDYYRAQGKLPALVEIDAVTAENDDGDKPRTLEETMIAPDLSPHELAEQTMLCTRVRQAISTLLPTQERVIALRLEGLDTHEIAAEIGKGVNATKALQHRGFVNLQEWLQETT